MPVVDKENVANKDYASVYLDSQDLIVQNKLVLMKSVMGMEFATNRPSNAYVIKNGKVKLAMKSCVTQ